MTNSSTLDKLMGAVLMFHREASKVLSIVDKSEQYRSFDSPTLSIFVYIARLLPANGLRVLTDLTEPVCKCPIDDGNCSTLLATFAVAPGSDEAKRLTH